MEHLGDTSKQQMQREYNNQIKTFKVIRNFSMERHVLQQNSVKRFLMRAIPMAQDVGAPCS